MNRRWRLIASLSAERAGMERHIALRIGADRGDVMVESSDLGIALQFPSLRPIDQRIIPLVGQEL